MSAALAMRRAECERILAKRPNTCPILLTSANGKMTTVSLAPTATMADVEAAVRDVAVFPPRKAVNLAVDGCTPSPATLVGEVYTACKSEDGFLHVSFSGEKRLGFTFLGPCMYINTDGGDSTRSENDLTGGGVVGGTDALTNAANGLGSLNTGTLDMAGNEAQVPAPAPDPSPAPDPGPYPDVDPGQDPHQGQDADPEPQPGPNPGSGNVSGDDGLLGFPVVNPDGTIVFM